MTTQVLSSETKAVVEEVVRRRLQRRAMHRPIFEHQVCDLVGEVFSRIQALEVQRAARGGGEQFWTRALNGQMTIKHHAPFYAESADADARFVRALTTGALPGQALVPVVQANAFVEMLSLGSTMRRAGATIWPMSGVEELRVPVGLTSPLFVFMQQNSKQTPDPNFNLSQVSLTLKEHRALIPLPLNLFRAARPALESLLTTFLALGAGEGEDVVFHSSTTLTDSPAALMAASGVTFINVGGSANGGNISWSDITAMIQKASELKLPFPWAWFCSPRTWTRLWSIASTTSQLLLGAPAVAGGEWTFCGWPLYLTNSISNSETLGSGSSQSHLVLCHPGNIHIGEDHALAFEVSEHFGLDTGDVNVRLIHHVDIDYKPATGFVILRGIN